MATQEKSRRFRRGDDQGDEEQSKKATDAAEETLEDAGDDTGDAKSTAEKAVGAAVDAVKGSGKGSGGLFKLVANAARDAAGEVLEREARAGAKQAAELLAEKGPELVRGQLEQHGGSGPAAKAAMEFGKAKMEGAGGPKALLEGAGGAVKGVVDKVGGGGGGKDKGLGQTRRLPVECTIDIGAPRETVYNQWTQFEDAPQYMHRIKSVDQPEDRKLKVQGKIWGFKREWTVEIEEQIPNERIQWKVVGGTRHSGVVTFHELEEDLTRVILILDFPPQGLTEKMASGLRLVKRATTADLKRFRAFIMMKNEETGAWRGKIEDGEVTSPEEMERQQDEGDEPRAQGDEEPEGREDEDAEGRPDSDEDYEEPEGESDEDYEEPEGESDEDYEEPEGESDEDYDESEDEDEEPEGSAEDDEEEEPEPAKKPQPRRQRSRASSSSSGSGTRRKSRASS